MEKGKELNDFQRNPLEIEILSNLRFGSLEIRDTSVTRVTNKINIENTSNQIKTEIIKKLGPCVCNTFTYDTFGDHLQNCQPKSVVSQVYDWVVYKYG